MIPYGINIHNLSYGNIFGNHNCCIQTKDPDFSLYHSLMSIVYSDCDKRKFTYNTCQQEWNVFNIGIMAVSNNISQAFDTICPCAIYGRVCHTFKGYEELKSSIAIRKGHIQICVALQKIKGIGTNQNYTINSLRLLTIRYLNCVILLPQPSQPPVSQNAVSSTCID